MRLSPLHSRAARGVAAALAVALGGCTVGVDDPAPRPVIGGVYQYSALLGSEAVAAFAGTIILRDGPEGRLAGSYRLPLQCRSPEGAAADCAGTVSGLLAGDGTLTFDFDTDRFHHVGRVDHDGVLRGIWILTTPATPQAPEGRTTGPFQGTPAR